MGLRPPPAGPVAITAALAVLAGAPVAAQPSSGQAAVRSAHMTVEMSADSPAAEVRMEYLLVGPVEGSLRIELLGFGEATAASFRVDGEETPVALATETGSMRAASWEVPTGEAPRRLHVRYTVERATTGEAPALRVRVPVLVVDLPPEEGRSRVFDVAVRVPDGWAVTEAFPTALAGGDAGVLEAELAAVPAMIGFRVRTDGATVLGLPQALDALAVVLIVGFALVGWRHLERVAA